MRLRSVLMVGLLASVVSCSQQSEHVQRHSDFVQAIQNRTTSPSFVKIKVIDSVSRREFTTCVTANLFLGAMHIEYDLDYGESERGTVKDLVTSNRQHSFTFKSPAALKNMPWHPTASELSEAKSIVLGQSDSDIRESLKTGTLRDYYANHSRYDERMGAIACALVDRGMRPRLADISGILYVEK